MAPSRSHRRGPLNEPSPHTRFKGVRQRSWSRWVSEIRIPCSRDKIWLGSHLTPEAAARAYDTAYLLLRGPSASSSLNLSDSLHLITPHLAAYTNGRHAITRRVIQTAVAAIANAIAGVGTPLVDPAADQQGTTSAMPDAEKGETRCRHGSTGNPMEETCLHDVTSTESCWIHDAVSSLSPREKTSCRLISGSGAAALNYELEGTGSLSWSTNLLQQQLISANSLDEFHQELAQDGFTPMSPAIIIRREI